MTDHELSVRKWQRDATVAVGEVGTNQVTADGSHIQRSVWQAESVAGVTQTNFSLVLQMDQLYNDTSLNHRGGHVGLIDLRSVRTISRGGRAPLSGTPACSHR